MTQKGILANVLCGTLFITCASCKQSTQTEPLDAPALEDDAPEWAGAIRARFYRHVSFEFVATPIGEAVRFFETLTRATTVMDLEIDSTRPVTLRVNDHQLAGAFQDLLREAGLTYVVHDKVVYVSTPQRLAAWAARGFPLRRSPDVRPASGARDGQ